ncbi:MAG TPA: spermidine synthase [Thermoproteota archaeon]|nr:spermidine synthase [Thermoproteota archaeon]
MNSRSWRAYYLTQGSEPTLALFPIERIAFSGRSRFQRIEVVDFEELGRGLVLDGLIQAVESDEFVYHESLVQTALYNCSRPKRVAIVGGGDGGALREVLRCKTVGKVTMVDIDRKVVDVSKKYLGSIHRGSFGDKRANVVIGDGRQYLSRRRSEFDIIIVDITDPVPSGPALFLYSVEFYRLARRALNPSGVLVTQASPYEGKQFTRVLRSLDSVFDKVLPFHAYVKTFADDWGFVLATDQPSLRPSTSQSADGWISRAISGKNRYLGGTTYCANLAISPSDKRRLGKRVKPITDSEARRKNALTEASSPWVYQ